MREEIQRHVEMHSTPWISAHRGTRKRDQSHRTSAHPRQMERLVIPAQRANRITTKSLRCGLPHRAQPVAHGGLAARYDATSDLSGVSSARAHSVYRLSSARR
jgi:hypothetical protein